MKTEKIKQLKNAVWIIAFIDENAKRFVRFVSNTVVESWERKLDTYDTIKIEAANREAEILNNSNPITISELEYLVGTNSTVKMWAKDGMKRIYINNNKGQATGWYDFNTNQTGSKFSAMMRRNLKIWFANGIAI